MTKILCFAFFTILISSQSWAQLITSSFGSGANAFDMDFVTISNPGNLGDVEQVNPIPQNGGSVSYVYAMGKYEVTRDMINKANAAANIGITLVSWPVSYGSDVNGPLRPAGGISWNEAARFVNYLNMSQGFSAAYKFTTSGVNDNIALWTSGEAGFNINNPFRNSLARYVLPTADEWYKAAFFDPNKPGGAGYWDYPTGSDNEPISVAGGTADGTNVSNWARRGPADVNDAGGLSPYGTMAQGGNVDEWNETQTGVAINGGVDGNRYIRGGDWSTSPGAPNVMNAGGLAPQNEPNSTGFRVVSLVPEPSSLSLLALGGLALALNKRRRA
jgi:formylglycine-generating enzyme required for sulfatase activity